jgi:MFS family permease
MAYAVLVVSALFFEIALNLPVGTMPLALTQDGTPRPAIAVAMGCGMFAALFASLPVGALTDRFGRLATIRAAAFLGAASLAGLAFAHGPVLGGVLLGVRSIAIVAYMTAEFAYASELASKDRAVSGVATLGMIGNLTFAVAPALSVVLWQHGVGREQYVYATALALAGAAGLFLLPKRHDVRSGAKHAPLLMHPRWLPAMGFAAATTLQGGVNGALAILTFGDRGIANGAVLFSASALVSFALRYPSGRLVDRFGPRAIAIPVAAIQATGCLLAAEARSLEAVVVAGACFGLAWSAVVPVTLGLLFEHSTSRTRGAAMGAYNLAFSGGAAIGAVLATCATLAGPGYPLAIALCSVAPLAVLPFVLRSRRSTRVVAQRAAVAAASGALGD